MDKAKMYTGGGYNQVEKGERHRSSWDEAILVDYSSYEHAYEANHNVYAATLTARDNPAVGFFATVRYEGKRPYAAIHLYDSGEGAKLVERFRNEAVFSDEIDQTVFEMLATDEYTLSDVMVYLNQAVAGAKEDELFDHLCNVLGVDDLRDYDGAYADAVDESVEIRLDNDTSLREPESLEDFTKRVNESMPEILFEPLTKANYFKAVEVTLPLLASDRDA